jgi:SPP1 family predicted phage head-tail adaptor
VDTYTTFTTVWGSVNPLSAREQINAQQANMEVTHKVNIRYSTTAAAILGTTRIVFGTRTFEVTSITKPNEISEQYELLCKEIL